MVLKVKDLTVFYGTLLALNKVNFEVKRNEIVALLGPNGAGKTTALRAIVGILKDFKGKIEKGEILFYGKSINGLPPYELVKMGISFVPQGRKVFYSMTVMENLEMGGYIIKNRNQLVNRISRIFELFPFLFEKRFQRAGILSGGEQQMLSIARALLIEPKLLILDEPLAGLSPNYSIEIMKKLLEIKKAGTSILLVEHNIKFVLRYIDFAYVFAMGEIKLKGSSNTLLKRFSDILKIL